MVFVANNPDSEIHLETGEVLNPLVTLINDKGDRAQVCFHHDCLVLAVLDKNINLYKFSPYIFKEAWRAMRNLRLHNLW